MKKILILVLIAFSTFKISAQAKIDFQVGGANFLGAALNAEFDIPVNKEKEHYLMPRFGIGLLGTSNTIMHLGLHYRMNKFGVGCEVSNFSISPFTADGYINDFVDVLLYPNINYTLIRSKDPKWYYRFSAGAYFAYSKYTNYDQETYLEWEGDMIPGIGITAGYMF